MFGDPFFTSQSFSASSGGPSGASFTRKVSTSTKLVNGKQIETTKVTENGVTTETVKENGRVVSQKTISGDTKKTPALK